jgi:hypothetical protein
VARYFIVYNYFYKRLRSLLLYKDFIFNTTWFLKLLKLLVRLWTNISINYIIDLPKCLYNSKIYRYIFIIINCLIKIKYFIFITSLNIEEFIKAFIYTIYKLYSTLSTIIFNKGSLFIFNF